MRTRWLAVVALGVLPACAYLAGPADARRPAPLRSVDSPSANVRVEIVVEGEPAVVYRDRQYRWVEGRRGDRFAFRVTNLNSFPVGVILSADGQSLTADGRASASHPAYVIEAGQCETVSIWRQDLDGGRELVFTDVERSLAARKGDRRNIGVLGVLVWQLADQYLPPPPPVPIDREGRPPRSASGRDEAAPKAGAERREDDRGIGVGAGGRRDDRAYLTDRYRRVRMLGDISIYYDDRTGLERAGVDLGQYGDPVVIDRRRADPFPTGGDEGVRIP